MYFSLESLLASSINITLLILKNLNHQLKKGRKNIRNLKSAGMQIPPKLINYCFVDERHLASVLGIKTDFILS